MSSGLGKRVCVIGAGAAGLGTLKNFREEGFVVVAFERTNYVGGLWHVTDDENQLSVLSSTRTIASKYGMAFSDLPQNDGVGFFPSAREMEDYLERYAACFELKKLIQFNSSVTRIARDEHKRKWIVSVTSTVPPGEGSTTHEFDRVVICTGHHTVPNWPSLPNREIFEGEIIHANAFKRASKYAGKTVLVIGVAATSVDVADFLVAAGVGKLYVSHRHTLTVVPRLFEGKPMDAAFTKQATVVMSYMRSFSPKFFLWFFRRTLQNMMFKAFPQLRDHPSAISNRPEPNFDVFLPAISSTFVGHLASGAVESVQGVGRIAGAHSVELTDGTVLTNIDAIICATGATPQIAPILAPEVDPSNPAFAPDGRAALESSKHYHPGLIAPRLYHQCISIQYPHSLAFMNYCVLQGTYPPFVDLLSLTIAHLWKGTHPLPERVEMEAYADRKYAQLVKQLGISRVPFPGFEKDFEWVKWIHKTAGTGLFDRLGNWGSWECWKLWWNDPELYKMCFKGYDSPSMIRLFDTGQRKKWDGARQVLEKTNAELDEFAKKWKHETDVNFKQGKAA